MTDALLKLVTWLSPAYPVGAYTYSHGLETAIASGEIHDLASTEDWIADCLTYGAGRNDAILVAHAWRMADDATGLSDLAALARALAPSAERALETEAMGQAFGDVTDAVWADGQDPAPYPVAVGAAAASAGIPLPQVLPVYVNAFVSNLVSVAVRLVPLGQTDGQRIIAALMPACQTVATDALHAELDDIGSCAIRSDIASMRHETQDVRLFRS